MDKYEYISITLNIPEYKHEKHAGDLKKMQKYSYVTKC